MFDKKKIISIILTTCLIIPVLGTTAFATSYNRTAAVQYAEAYALDYNSDYKSYSSDCANFVSQCLKAGNWTYVNPYNNITSNSVWWYHDIFLFPDENSNTWSVANSLLLFTGAYSNPMRGSIVSDYSGTTSVPYPNGVSAGDVFFYDWAGDGGVNHASIYVANGTDPNGNHYSGALIDQHTSDRYHAIWSLSSYNQYKLTTRIYSVHMNNSF
jgi:hypothetical protein